MMKDRTVSKKRVILLVPLLLLGLLGYETSRARQYDLTNLSRRLSVRDRPVPPYSYLDIEKSAALFSGYYARFLLFDGNNFTVYNIRNKQIKLYNSPYGGRALRAIPLLVRGLKEHFPGRFKEGQPPFQVMYTDGDAINLGACTNHPENCDMNHMPPLLSHGSFPHNENAFPFIKGFPNWFYGDCVYNMKVKGKKGPCSWWEGSGSPGKQPTWEDLIPTLVWRGADHAFLPHVEEYSGANQQRGNFPMLKKVTEKTTREELAQDLISRYKTMTPRWRAVIKTIINDKEEKRWIDVRFAGEGSEKYHEVFNKHDVIVRDAGMNTEELSKYRYQIDFGGGGGTTWRGVLTKLAMPGVLFHHETFMKDWFFDLMIPWVHYIPVRWDLSDLEERYHWAEANPGRCQEISHAASELARYLLSEEYMEKLYHDLYGTYMGKVIEAYQPTDEEKQLSGWTLQAHFINTYEKDGFEVTPVSKCDEKMCQTSWNDGSTYDVPYVTEARKGKVKYSY